jgi:hypothetical protein
MRRLFILLTLIALLLYAGSAAAMSSTHYRLDWFTPLTAGGGGTASSVHHAVNLTVGQAVIGAATSTNYKTGLGYWYGAGGAYRILLPIVLK